MAHTSSQNVDRRTQRRPLLLTCRYSQLYSNRGIQSSRTFTRLPPNLSLRLVALPQSGVQPVQRVEVWKEGLLQEVIDRYCAAGAARLARSYVEHVNEHPGI